MRGTELLIKGNWINEQMKKFIRLAYLEIQGDVNFIVREMETG